MIGKTLGTYLDIQGVSNYDLASKFFISITTIMTATESTSGKLYGGTS
jgi:hypothetical protein